jgi:hypothetical protein
MAELKIGSSGHRIIGSSEKRRRSDENLGEWVTHPSTRKSKPRAPGTPENQNNTKAHMAIMAM